MRWWFNLSDWIFKKPKFNKLNTYDGLPSGEIKYLLVNDLRDFALCGSLLWGVSWCMWLIKYKIGLIRVWSTRVWPCKGVAGQEWRYGTALATTLVKDSRYSLGPSKLGLVACTLIQRSQVQVQLKSIFLWSTPIF